MGASLIRKSYLWQNPLLLFLTKKRKFTMAPTDILALSRQFSEIYQWKSHKLLQIYVIQVILTNSHLHFGGPSSIFYRGGGGKMAILAKFSTRYSTGSLLYHNGKQYRELKTLALINDYRIIFTPNLAGVD